MSTFRGKIMSLLMIQETGETSRKGSDRLAALYRSTEAARTFKKYLGSA